MPWRAQRHDRWGEQRLRRFAPGRRNRRVLRSPVRFICLGLGDLYTQTTRLVARECVLHRLGKSGLLGVIEKHVRPGETLNQRVRPAREVQTTQRHEGMARQGFQESGEFDQCGVGRRGVKRCDNDCQGHRCLIWRVARWIPWRSELESSCWRDEIARPIQTPPTEP